MIQKPVVGQGLHVGDVEVGDPEAGLALVVHLQPLLAGLQPLVKHTLVDVLFTG